MVLMIALVQQKKKSVDFSRVKAKICLILYCKCDESYLYVNKTEICKYKAKDSIGRQNFCLGISKDFRKDEQKEISLNGTAYDFSVDHSLVKKEDILNIHECLIG